MDANNGLYKKELLFRKNKSKFFLHGYVEKILNLLSITPSDIMFLSLEESDSIRNFKFKSEINKSRYCAENFDLKDTLLKILGKDSNTDHYYLFIDQDWEYCGGIQVNKLNLINSNFKFGDIILDDIVFIRADFKIKIIFDCYEMNNQYIVECETFVN